MKDIKTFYEIGKTYTFETSHIVGCQDLSPYKCRDSIHGHSYSLTISITASKLFNSFILDYGYLDKFMKPEIDKIDHSYLYGNKDEKKIIEFMKNNKLRIYHISEDYPTAEYISKHFAEFAFNELKKIVKEEQFRTFIKIKVTVKETSKTFATYTINV